MKSNNLLSLDLLSKGQTARVRYIKKNDNKRRFLDLGIIPNTIIKNERSSPSGNPIAFKIRGTIIAIRKDDAKNILINLI